MNKNYLVCGLLMFWTGFSHAFYDQENFDKSNNPSVTEQDNQYVISIRADHPLDLNAKQLAKSLASKHCPRLVANLSSDDKISVHLKQLEIDEHMSFGSNVYETKYSFAKQVITCDNFRVEKNVRPSLTKLPSKSPMRVEDDIDLEKNDGVVEFDTLTDGDSVMVNWDSHPYIRNDRPDLEHVITNRPSEKEKVTHQKMGAKDLCCDELVDSVNRLHIPVSIQGRPFYAVFR